MTDQLQENTDVRRTSWRRICGGFAVALSLVFQTSVIIAAFAFVQGQEPQLENSIDQETKALHVGHAGFAPASLKIYAIAFDLPLISDERGRPALNPAVPIQSTTTRGKILEETLWFPRSEINIDLKRESILKFDVADPFTSALTVYCLAIEARNVISNQSVVETLLTQKSLFSVSAFSPLGAIEALGGGSNAKFFAAERLMNSECRALYEKMRHGMN
jgi:hypothetical protein